VSRDFWGSAEKLGNAHKKGPANEQALAPVETGLFAQAEPTPD